MQTEVQNFILHSLKIGEANNTSLYTDLEMKVLEKSEKLFSTHHGIELTQADCREHRDTWLHKHQVTEVLLEGSKTSLKFNFPTDKLTR